MTFIDLLNELIVIVCLFSPFLLIVRLLSMNRPNRNKRYYKLPRKKVKGKVYTATGGLQSHGEFNIKTPENQYFEVIVPFDNIKELMLFGLVYAPDECAFYYRITGKTLYTGEPLNYFEQFIFYTGNPLNYFKQFTESDENNKNNSKKYWLLELVKEFIPSFWGIAALSWITMLINIYVAIIIGVTFSLLLKLYKRFYLKKPPKSTLYRLHQAEEREAAVIERNIHDQSFLSDCLLDLRESEWFVFETSNGEQIKVYISAGGINPNKNLAFVTPAIGDVGKLYYRKGKHLYFEDFVKNEPEELEE